MSDVRADRRDGARPRGQGDDQPARRDRRVADAARAARRGGGGGPGRRRHPVRVLEAALDARRRDGVLDRARSATWSSRGPRRDRAPRGSSCTTPPCATARRGPGLSYSVEDRLRILHKLDQLGVPFIEGGWPGANPRDTEFFRLATRRDAQARDADGVRDDPARRARRRTQRRPARPARRGDRGRLPRRQGLGPPRRPRRSGRTSTRAWRWSATRSRSCAGRGAGCSSTPSTSSTGTGATRRSRSGCWPRPRRRAPSAWCCATRTAACCRTRSRASSPRSASAVDTPLGIHVHNDAGCAVANSLIAVEHGAFQVQGVVNGYGERTGNADIDPDRREPRAEDGRRVPARGRRSSASPSSRTTWPRSRTSPPTRASPTRAGTPSRTRPGCTRAASHACRDAYEHVAPARRRQPARRRRVRPRGRRDDPDEGDGVRPRAGRRRRRSRRAGRAEGARGARVHVRGRRRLARAADAPRDGLAAAVLRGRQLPRPRRGARRRRRGAARRGDREGRHEGDAAHRERRGPGAGRRARQRAAQGARERLPRARAHRARGLPGARAGRDARARAPWSAC